MRYPSNRNSCLRMNDSNSISPTKFSRYHFRPDVSKEILIPRQGPPRIPKLDSWPETRSAGSPFLAAENLLLVPSRRWCSGIPPSRSGILKTQSHSPHLNKFEVADLLLLTTVSSLALLSVEQSIAIHLAQSIAWSWILLWCSRKFLLAS